jgi:hypothetical protein
MSQQETVMRFSEDDHDIGTIVLTVIVTLILGAGVYWYNTKSSIQTAFAPAIEKTVPTIVPSTPRF